ncbi:hypothetical protein [Streptomyces sp. NPDC005573]|uniref:hypothetical protein n=1 Tax=Streptomyces sp. NPDC005573 TaxID=3156890 RepID=UPI0033AA7FC2
MSGHAIRTSSSRAASLADRFSLGRTIRVAIDRGLGICAGAATAIPFLEERLVAVEWDVASASGGRNQNVQLGVAIASGGLSVQAGSTSHLAQRVAVVEHALDEFVSLLNPLHEERGRQRLQQGHARCRRRNQGRAAVGNADSLRE